MRVVITRGCMNPRSRPALESSESLSAYSDLQAEATSLDIDWYAVEFEQTAEQTLGGGSLC